jgi:hypothetical protein
MKTKDPYLADGGILKMIANMAARNVWRLAGWEVADLTQEGFVCYLKVKDRYWWARKKRPTIDDLRTVVYYTKRTFTNRIHDLSKRQCPYIEVNLTDYAVERAGTEMTSDDFLGHITPSYQTEAAGDIAILIKSAPWELQQLFDLLCEDVTSGYRRYGKRRRKSKRETTNQRFCRLLGLSSNVDLNKMLVEHFDLAC